MTGDYRNTQYDENTDTATCQHPIMSYDLSDYSRPATHIDDISFTMRLRKE